LRIGFLLVLLLSLAVSVSAQTPQEKQQAKQLAEKAQSEGSDRARQVQDYCAATRLDPSDRKIAAACASYRSGLLNDDSAWLASAIAAYKNHDLDRAESNAKLVSSYDDKLSGQARFVLALVKNDRLLAQVKSAWDKGDFATVLSAAQAIDNPADKTAAAAYVNNVSLYNSYIAQANQLQASSPQKAIDQLALAQALNPSGPANPTARIAEIQKAMQAKTAPPPPPQKPVDSAAETAKKIAKLTADAHADEQKGNLQEAVNRYTQILKLDPANKDAQANTDRIEQLLKSDPAAARNQLKSAIRSFYQAQFEDAERALRDYLKSPQTAKDSGPAYFYLGATLVAHSMLDTPRTKWPGPSADAQTAFREARKASYNPVRSYLSPALLKVWDTAQ
jgi:hypothetical protein